MFRSSSPVSRVAISLVGVLFACGLMAETAGADSIPVSGVVELHSHGGDFPEYPGPVHQLIYGLGGPGLPRGYGVAFQHVPALGTHGNLEITRFDRPSPLVAGATHNLSTRATFTIGHLDGDQPLPGGGPVDYNIAGDFLFTAGTALLSADSQYSLIGQAPVKMMATLRGFDIDTGALLFSHTLHAAGTGTVMFTRDNPEFFYYNYDLAPVPEPATLLLLGSGLGGLVVAARRRRTRAPSRS